MSSQVEKLRQLNNNKAIEIEHNFNEQDQSMIPSNKENNDDDHVHGHNCKHNHNKNSHGASKGHRKNYGIIGYTIFTCFSCLYLQVYYFYPLHPDPFKKSILPMISYCVVFLALWSYIQTIITTNQVSKVKGAPNLIDHRLIDTNYLSKQCDKCKYYKMPRVSHCSTCGHCILKLDHHCMWTQNCIGFRNQKPFYYFTVWMTIGLLQFWTSSYVTYFEINGKCSFFNFFQPGVYLLWGITCFSASFVGIMIVALFFSHTLMILTNNTTLMQIKTKKICPTPFCQCRSLILEDGNVNQYDRGQIQNIRNLFGTKNILLSLMPLTRDINHDFLCEMPNPLPTPMQIAKFVGDLEADVLRDRELREQLRRLKQIFKGKKFRVKEQVIQL